MDPADRNTSDHRLNENSEGGGAGTAMAMQKKRSRRVSFAEMTSVHFFDRDDESNGTPRQDTAKLGDEVGTGLGFEKLEDQKQSEGGDDEDNDEEMNLPKSFLRPFESPSPGSTIGSATSNDEDNFFGPVSASFIRPGRLSDSAASDDNHDVTMDSTAFSMHFRSLARSESGVDLKTPTGFHLSFEEKTATNANVGSSMKLTLVKKPISESSIPATNISGRHDSNDMSLVGENPNKYNYEKLSPRLDALLAESRKQWLAVGSPDDISASHSPVRMKSRFSVSSSHGDSPMDLSEFAKQERGAIISHDLLSKEVSDIHDKYQETNGGAVTSPICYPPQGCPFNRMIAASEISNRNRSRSPDQFIKDNPVNEESVKANPKMWKPDASTVNRGDGLSEPNDKLRGSNQYSHNKSRSPIVGSTSLPTKRRQTSPSMASPSKHLRLGTPSLEHHSFVSNENIKRLESDLSIQKSISKLELFEKSSFSSTFSTEMDKSFIKSLDFSNLPPFDTFEEKYVEDLQMKHLERSVNGTKLLSMKEQGTLNVVGNRLESSSNNFGENHLEESLAHRKSGKEPKDIGAMIHHADQPTEYNNATASPSQFTGSGKNKEHDFITLKHTNENVLNTCGTDSSLANPTSHKGAQAIVNSDESVTLTGRKLDCKLTTSPQNQCSQLKELELQNQYAQLPDLDPVRDLLLNKNSIHANLLKPTAGMDSLSTERIEELSTPIIEVEGSQNLTEVQARGDTDVGRHTKKEVYETTYTCATPIAHEKSYIMHSAMLDGDLQTGKDIPQFENNLLPRTEDVTHSSVSSSSRKLNEPRLDKMSPELQKGGHPDESRVAVMISHEWKQWKTVLQIYSKISEDIKQLISHLTKEFNPKQIDVLEDVLLHLQRQKTYELLRYEIMPQETSNLHNLKYERVGKTRSLLHQVLLEKAKLQLKNVKQERLLKKLHILSSRIQESHMLRASSLSRLLKTCAANVNAPAGFCQSFSVDSEDGHEGVCDKLTIMRQTLEVSEREIANLNRIFHASCKIKGEPSCGNTIGIVNECLMKRAHCRLTRLYMQSWEVRNVESFNGQQNVVLIYLGLIEQSLKVTLGSVSTIAISIKLKDTNIIKTFPNMGAPAAFSFVFDANASRKYVGARTLRTETQVTSSLLGTLLDVLEEIQLAQIKLPNLIQSSFYCSVDQLHLQLCFCKFSCGRKVILTLDLSCLKRGIYPSDAFPSHVTAPVDGPQYSSSETTFAEIGDAIKMVSIGYGRIFRLCKCVSQALQASSA